MRCEVASCRGQTNRASDGAGRGRLGERLGGGLGWKFAKVVSLLRLDPLWGEGQAHQSGGEGGGSSKPSFFEASDVVNIVSPEKEGRELSVANTRAACHVITDPDRPTDVPSGSRSSTTTRLLSSYFRITVQNIYS